MNLALAFDPMFRVPMMLGLVFAVLLPLFGAWLRLRNEWLAALGYTHIAAAGALASGFLHWPVLLTALVAAGIAAVIKGLSRRPGNDMYAAMTVAGWAFAMLIAANSHHGEVLGQTLLRGQLYFAEASQLWLALGVGVGALALLPWLKRRLLVQRFFPDQQSANQKPSWTHETALGLIAVVLLVLATTALGAMAAFALVFVPPWVAFRLCSSWRRAVGFATIAGVIAYVVAFLLAIGLDQPLGPMLAAIVLLLAPLRLLGRVL